MSFKTKMHEEANEFPSIVKKHRYDNADVEHIVKKLKENSFSSVCTFARGSSDHAALFAKYLIENKMQILVSSFSPSVWTQYKSKVNFSSTLVLTISQSGKSDDLVQSLLYAKNSGAITVAFVNNETSLISTQSNYFIPLSAGEELAVTATKSFLSSILRIVQFVAHWSNDAPMLHAHSLFQPILSDAIKNYSWDPHLPKLKDTRSMFVVGRGYGYPIALEAALKFKETCGIHAEAVSGAEILHGPFELVNENFCTFLFLQDDATLNSMLALIDKLEEHKTHIFVVATEEIIAKIKHKNTVLLPTIKSSLHPILDLIISIQCFYFFVGNLSLLMGRNPDQPKNLKKVTKTI